MESSKSIVLKQKYNSALLKPYIEYVNEEANAPDRNYKERFDNEQSIQEKIFWDIMPD